MVLEHNFLRIGGHPCSWSRIVPALKMIAHLEMSLSLLQSSNEKPVGQYLSHGHPFNILMLVDIFNNSFVHQQHMWSTRYIRMDCHWENELICILVCKSMHHFSSFKLEKEVTYRTLCKSSQNDLSKCPQRPWENLVSLGNDVVSAQRRSAETHLGLTHPWEFAELLMNIIGGRSSMYHEPGISTSPVSWPLTRGFIQLSASFV